MPKRSDIQSVLVIGSGPIVIGQAAEFDYSGTQACRVLKAEGLRVILVNSNPATIMTDPEIADATYVEPITPEFVEKIIAKERPDALLPTLGGQTALNTAISMHENGVLEKYGVELIGANVEAINKGEDRDLFKGVVEAVKAKIGYGESARSVICHSMDDVLGASTRSAATPSSSAPPSPWAAPVPASRTTRRSCAGSPVRASRSPRPPRCSWRSPSSAGRSTSWS